MHCLLYASSLGALSFVHMFSGCIVFCTHVLWVHCAAHCMRVNKADKLAGLNGKTRWRFGDFCYHNVICGDIVQNVLCEMYDHCVVCWPSCVV